MTDTPSTATPEQAVRPATQEQPVRPVTVYGEKRDRLVGDRETFKNSAPHQAAGQTWAIADEAEAIREGNDLDSIRNRMISRQIQLATTANEIAERHAAAAELSAALAERQLAALERANDLAAEATEATTRQTEATVALVREQRIANLLRFYTTDPNGFYENGRAVLTKALAEGKADEAA